MSVSKISQKAITTRAAKVVLFSVVSVGLCMGVCVFVNAIALEPFEMSA